MFIDFLLDVFKETPESDAIVWKDEMYSYEWLVGRIAFWNNELENRLVRQGAVVSLEADFSPNAVALFLALVERGCVLVPLSSSVEMHKERFCEIACVNCRVDISQEDNAIIHFRDTGDEHPLLKTLRDRKHPGLVLFSSGSTGEPKGAVHDLVPLLRKYHLRKKAEKVLSFLLFDHLGGFDTLLHTLSNGGCLVTVQGRNPDAVFEAVEKYKVEALPTSSSFLNMVLISEAYKRHNVASLKRIIYGAEVMPESTLKAINIALPSVKLQQSYGVSEVGVLRSKSLSADSLWVKLGGEGFQTRVVNGVLQVKAESAMLGYLNAAEPFTEDGWFITGDEVEVDGEFYLIKGRSSDVINVGGKKVYPAEVENVLLQMENVLDVVVTGEKNPILGQIVYAKVTLIGHESVKEFSKKMHHFCKEKLQSFQIPQKISVEERAVYNARYKKIRRHTN